MEKVFYPRLNRVVAADAMAAEFSCGGVEITVFAFPEKLVTPDDAGQLIREQVDALRQYADMFEAQIPKMQNMGTVK